MRRILCALAVVSMLALCLAHAEEMPTYRIEVDLSSQVVTVYLAQGEGAIVRQMICSAGTPGGEDATPCGDFTVKQHYPDERSEWYYIKNYKVYVKYATRFSGPYMFHSLPYASKDMQSIDRQAEAMLGQSVSHGCLRLRVEDARWIALNCPDGTSVHIYESGQIDEELRSMLLKRSYDAQAWSSYAKYRAAMQGKGLVGALEQSGFFGSRSSA